MTKRAGCVSEWNKGRQVSTNILCVVYLNIFSIPVRAPKAVHRNKTYWVIVLYGARKKIVETCRVTIWRDIVPRARLLLLLLPGFFSQNISLPRRIQHGETFWLFHRSFHRSWEKWSVHKKTCMFFSLLSKIDLFSRRWRWINSGKNDLLSSHSLTHWGGGRKATKHNQHSG